MNRRGFLGAMVGGIATAAAVRTWPFRVYSFPAEPMAFSLADLPPVDAPLIDSLFGNSPWMFHIGDLVRVGVEKHLYKVTEISGLSRVTLTHQRMAHTRLYGVTANA